MAWWKERFELSRLSQSLLEIFTFCFTGITEHRSEMPTTTISTPVTDGLTKESLLAALHSHEMMVKILCPALISHSLESGSEELNSPAVYTVTDKKPIGQTTFKLTLTNVPDGVDTLVNAKPPVGTLTIAGQWRIVEEEGKMTLKEDVEIDANMIMKKMAKGNVEGTHPKQHVALLEQAAKA